MRVSHKVSLAAVVAVLALLGAAAPAVAGEAHPYANISFGRNATESFSNPNGIAVAEATGDVYVADIGTNTVYKYDASGNAVDFSGLASNALTGPPGGSFSFPDEPGNPAAVAVDNSTSPSDPSSGDLYVMDSGHGVIDKFTAKGEFLDQIAAPFRGELMGLGVDPDGNLRVYTSYTDVDLFDHSVVNNFIANYGEEGGGVTGGTSLEDRRPAYGFAAGPATDAYASGDNYLLYSCGCTQKFGGNEEPLGMVDSGSPADVAVAVDQATGHLYIDDQSSVSEWDTGGMDGPLLQLGTTDTVVGTGSLVSGFGRMQLTSTTGQGGIAVNGTSGNIYVSNPADGRVYVFASTAPGVSAAKSSNVTKTSATLQGTIEPRGVPLGSCVFEYEVSPPEAASLEGLDTPVSSYAHSVPCEQTPAQIGAGAAPVRVTATVGGLEAGQLYYYRLVATNANGSDASSGMLATSGPGFGVKAFEVSFLNKDGTPDTQAGSHPYKMVTNIAFNTRALRREAVADSRYAIHPDGNVKDVIVDLPPGLVGDPRATAQRCTLAELETLPGNNTGEGKCPAESIVGELEVEFGFDGFDKIREPVFNMVPPHGVALQIGANFIIPKAYINNGIKAGADYPVQAEALDISALGPILATRLTIFGVVGTKIEHEYEFIDTRKPFLTLPTGCTGPLRSTIEVDSYQKVGDFVTAPPAVTRDGAGEPLGLTGCSQLKFPPTITVSPDTANASTSSGLTVGVHVSQKAAFNPEGLAESALRDTTVTLPQGVAINPAGADGLETCTSDPNALTEAQEKEGVLGTPGDEIGFRGWKELNKEYEEHVQTATFTPHRANPLRPGVNFCPDGSKIGTVKIKTPLLEHELEGAVYLAAQNDNPFGSLVAMYMVAEDPFSGSLIKLAGEVTLTPAGQIVTTFKNTPDLPFEELQLHFFGGERAPLSTPSRCGTYTTKAVFTPWDGNGPVTSESSFNIEHGPNGSPCPGAKLLFNPTFTGGSTNLQAGSFTPLTGTFSREDGEQQMARLHFKLPPGLSGVLTGVKLCDEADANAGTCGPESLIGETTVAAGVGSDPITVKGGKVYLTGPYKGAPFGVSVVNPVKAGPFDLEHDTANPNQNPPCDCIVVRGKLEIDPLTTAVTITSNSESEGFAIPHMIDGVPVEIKKVNFETTRNDFQFNPTNCEKMSISGSAESSEGESRPVEVPFQVTNCARLAFKPLFEVSTSGKTSRSRGASLHVTLSYPKAPWGTQANIGSVKVDLPRQLPSRLTTLQKACSEQQFAANPAECPTASRVGFGKAITPILPVPLEGPAYFVSHGGAKFPELVIVLQGYGVTIDLHGETFIENGITSSTFRTVPDQPVQTFELNLPEGPYSALAAPNGVCSVTKTVLVKKKMDVKSKNGKTRVVTRKVKKTVAAGLAMPTAFTAQNGAVIHQNTPIEVTGCGAKAKKKTKARKQAHRNHKK